MKYERTLSIVQAAYLANGLTNNMDLGHYQKEGEDFDLTLWERDIVKGNMIACEKREPPYYDNDELCFRIDESREVYLTLCDEASRVVAGMDRHDDILEIGDEEDIIYRSSGCKVNIQLTNFTKESIARWFYCSGHELKAEQIFPNFKRQLDRSNDKVTDKSKLEQQNNKLLEEIEQLKNRTETLEPALTQNTNKQEIDFDNYANYLPVKGGSMKVLSSAFQAYPTEFKDYRVRDITKKSVEAWLKSEYECNTRDQDAFANILLQNFLRSN